MEIELKTERFEMRLDPHMVQRVDDWRAEQPDIPSRAEAMRRLAEAGLGVLGQGRIRISHGETLVLMMLNDLYAHLKIEEPEIDPKFVAEALWRGHHWGLKWKYRGLFRGHLDSEKVVHEVMDVLEMWFLIESGFDRLSDEGRKEVEEKVGPLGQHVRFPGFDGNNEGEHLSIARFLIDHLDRFVTFKGRSLNSHCPSIDEYRRMYEEFEPMRKNLVGRDLSGPEIINLLKA